MRLIICDQYQEQRLRQTRELRMFGEYFETERSANEKEQRGGVISSGYASGLLDLKQVGHANNEDDRTQLGCGTRVTPDTLLHGGSR